MSLLGIPDEILRRVAAFVGLEDCLNSMSCVCWTFRRLFNIEALRQSMKQAHGSERDRIFQAMGTCIDFVDNMLHVLDRELGILDEISCHGMTTDRFYGCFMHMDDHWSILLVMARSFYPLMDYSYFCRPWTFPTAMYNACVPSVKTVLECIAAMSTYKRVRGLCHHGKTFPKYEAFTKEDVRALMQRVLTTWLEVNRIRDAELSYQVPLNAFT